jgi:hypothetical protein
VCVSERERERGLQRGLQRIEQGDHWPVCRKHKKKTPQQADFFPSAINLLTLPVLITLATTLMPSFLASSHRACHLPVHAEKMMAKVYKRCCNFILQFLRVHREEDIFLSVHWRFKGEQQQQQTRDTVVEKQQNLLKLFATKEVVHIPG